MSEERPFAIDLGRLRMREKPSDSAALRAADERAAGLGFVEREPQGKRGRKPSPRTDQVHAKVLPPVAAEIATEARRRGVVQGVLIEEMWQLYKDKSGI